MPSKGFAPFFEIFSEGVVMTVSLITTVAFGERCVKRSAPLNVTGLGASVLALFYSIYGLNYWFNGMAGYDCTTLAAVNGTCMSASNALTYLHLFVKADASNRSNPVWQRYLRWVGVATTLFNWATLVVVHALLNGSEFDGIDGTRCCFTFEMTSFKLKWIAQFANQLFQVVAFVWPLAAHLKMMGSGSSKVGQRDSVFRTLVWKAMVASGVSLLFTIIVSALAFTKIDQVESGSGHLVIPVFPLAVLDNAVNLGAIIFAVHIPSSSGASPRMVTSVQVNTTGASGANASAVDKMGLTGASSRSSNHSMVSSGSGKTTATPFWSRQGRPSSQV